MFAKVVWIENGFAGFHFEDRVDLEHIFAAAQPEFSYRSPRLELEENVVVAFGSARTTMAIIDISVSGMKLIGGDTLIRGEEVTIELDGLAKRQATVKWKASDLVGVEFERPIPVDQLAEWAAQRKFRRNVRDMLPV